MTKETDRTWNPVMYTIFERVRDAYRAAQDEYLDRREYLGRYRKPWFRKRRWTPGRANSGYQVFSILERGFYDCWLIRYPVGSYIPKHTDPLPLIDFFRPQWAGAPKVFRVNIVLRHAEEGGEFRCKTTVLNTKRLVIFRPDKYEHEVTPVLRGERTVLSIGFAL